MLHSGRRQAKCFLSMIFLTTRRLYLSGACLKCAIHSFRDYFTLSQRHLASIPSKQCVMFASSCVALTMKCACKVQESRIRMSCIRHIVMCYMCHSHAVPCSHAVSCSDATSCNVMQATLRFQNSKDVLPTPTLQGTRRTRYSWGLSSYVFAVVYLIYWCLMQGSFRCWSCQLVS